MAQIQTLLLDTATWDLVLDASGNIAVASEPYALAQDAACACKLFFGEAYYNTVIGVPYFQEVLGQFPNFALIKSLFVSAAQSVQDVDPTSVKYFVQGFDRVNRTLMGQIQVRSATTGQLSAATFTVTVPV